MPITNDAKSWPGEELRGTDGRKIGKIAHVYLDRETGEPSFVSVRTGLLGTRSALLPVAQAVAAEDHVRVPFDKDTVKDAPDVDDDSGLTEEEEERLYAHYGLGYQRYEGPDRGASAAGADPGSGRTPGAARTGRDAGDLAAPPGGTAAPPSPTPAVDPDVVEPPVGGDAAAAAASPTDPIAGDRPAPEDETTRSAQPQPAADRERPAGGMRLRKYVVTEDVTITVPVSHEEFRLEDEPAPAGGAAPDEAQGGGRPGPADSAPGAGGRGDERRP